MRIKKKETVSSKKKALEIIIPGFFIALILGGLLIASYQPIKNNLVKSSQEKAYSKAGKLTAGVAEKNALKEEKAEFNPNTVTDLTLQDVIDGNNNAEGIISNFGVGKIAIPDLNIHLPILLGISNTNLAVGAGTMKEGQLIGQGNYALAGHHMNNANLLFGPLEGAKKGQKIFVTEFKTIYEYTITTVDVVDKTAVHLIKDKADKKLITLITCAEGGIKRYAIQGELSKNYSFHDPEPKIENVFQ